MRPYYLIPAVPALALVLMPVLPFLNSTGLWLGLPRLLVWGAVWVALLTPAMLLTGRLMSRAEAEK
ncbi:hypothetical protein [Fodinicola feengrottensis]|uniref:DUF3311 domain-containing protein n=1 Tax=Fodinicola feengrottensis TaxID=435914 RepID=A0ABP4TEG9_9ACTN|nr:hypothetical protein [Fodinicola feengrottensis]